MASGAQTSLVAVLMAALGAGGTYLGTRTQVKSEDRCVRIVEVQRQADLEATRIERAADLDTANANYNALAANCRMVMTVLQEFCPADGPGRPGPGPGQPEMPLTEPPL